MHTPTPEEQYDELLTKLLKSDRQTLIEELRAEEVDPWGQAQGIVDFLEEATNCPHFKDCNECADSTWDYFSPNVCDECQDEFITTLCDECNQLWLNDGEIIRCENHALGIDSLSPEVADVHDKFIQRLYSFINQHGAAFSSTDFLSEQTTERMFEPEKPENYSPRTFSRDVWGMEDPIFFVSGELPQREDWRRITKNDPRPLRMLVEYGNFDIGITEKVQRWMLRVSTRVVKNQPYLTVGGISINMYTHVARCSVYNCRWAKTLTWSDPRQENPSRADIREWQEFVVLSILAHLGEHKASVRNPFPRMYVKRYRDTDAMTAASRTWVLAQKELSA